MNFDVYIMFTCGNKMTKNNVYNKRIDLGFMR